MFEPRTLSTDLEAVREEYAPDALVLDVETDFETIPPAAAENLGLVVESLSPTSYPAEWLPDDVPQLLGAYVSSDFTIGMPGDGTVVWTRQTTPPTVFLKHRAKTTPQNFLDFLVAEAFVQLSFEDVPEHFLPFFGEHYRDLTTAIPHGPNDVYQIALALFEGWIGLHTRDVFESWDGEYDALYDTWEDTGERLDERLSDLPRSVALGETSFPNATEFACSAIKHGRELPAPFSALDTEAYLEYGPAYAVRWAEKTFEQLAEKHDARRDAESN
ncbi:hypothetical protein [Haloferax sp. DFSO60]|uniref:DUF7089 family protein n=1 Tax=Haloferax sp. DFSO60 TaxID=3388652 RepID=UPI00397D2A19